MTQLVDPQGRPISSKQRMRSKDRDTLFGGRRSRFQGVIATGLTPERLVSIFAEIERGQLDNFLTLAKELEQHSSQYRSTLGNRKLSVLKRKPVLTPISEDSRDVFIAEECNALVSSPEWLWMTLHLLDALGKGYSCVEMIWDFSEGQAWPRFKARDQRDFTLDRETRSKVMRKIPGTAELEDLPVGKYICHSPSLISGSPVDGALSRTVSILYLYSTLALHDMGDFLERFGSPTVWAEYANDGQLADTLAGLQELARAGYAAMPKGTKLETLDGARIGGSENLHQSIIRLLNEEISKVVQHQTMTTDNGSSRSQAEVHDEVSDDVNDFDVWCVCATQQQQVLQIFVDLNFGAGYQAPPIDRPGDDEDDVAKVADVLFGMADRGVRVPSRKLLEMTKTAAAGDDDELIQPKSTGKGDIPGSPSRYSEPDPEHPEVQSEAEPA